MKVVKKENPRKGVEFENVFWETYEFPLEEIQHDVDLGYLQEEVFGLAEDVIEHGRALDLIGDRLADLELTSFWEDWEWGLKKAIKTLEENQLIDAENLSSTVDVLRCLQEANKLMLEVIIDQDEQNKILKDEIDRVDNAWLYLFRFLVVWNVVLSVLFALSIFDVF